MATVLVIDDDAEIRELLAAVIEAEGHEAVLVDGGRKGLTAMAARAIDLAITDILMPDMEGIETIRSLRKINPTAKIVAISASEAYLTMASDLGADLVIAKPFVIPELRAILARLLAPGS